MKPEKREEHRLGQVMQAWTQATEGLLAFTLSKVEMEHLLVSVFQVLNMLLSYECSL